MGLRSINNPKSSFDDPYASTGLEAYLPSNAYITGAWYGTYGIWAGGYRGAGGGDGTTNLIQYVTIANTGNATSGGSLTQARQWLVGCSNGTRGLYMGGVAGNGSVEYNIIGYLTCATPDGNATDFGDLTLKRTGPGAGCDGVRALCMGGYDDGNYQNIIDYVAVAITGNATDFGDLSSVRGYGAACNDNMRAVYGGGEDSGGNKKSVYQCEDGKTDGNGYKERFEYISLMVKILEMEGKLELVKAKTTDDFLKRSTTHKSHEYHADFHYEFIKNHL